MQEHTAPPTAPNATHDPTIVVVDDDVSCLVAVDQILRHWGLETRTFRAFEDARSYLSHAQPAVVIVDVRLGTYNGLQLIHFSRQNSPNTRWVVVSGFDDPVLRNEATKLGAAFFTKPLDLQRLREFLPGATA
ncbi:MAG: response regulator [Acidobacteriota bacterium]|nr:response regulator [Acidobacteriota bacterium]